MGGAFYMIAFDTFDAFQLHAFCANLKAVNNLKKRFTVFQFQIEQI